jgi:hypothetical protein
MEQDYKRRIDEITQITNAKHDLHLKEQKKAIQIWMSIT